MIDFEIDSQFVVQTEADWGADATIYPANSGLLISQDAFWNGTASEKFKIPDGVNTWSNLDYPPIGSGSEDSIMISYFIMTNVNMADTTDYFFGQQLLVGLNENQCVAVPIPAGEVTDVLITKYIGSTFPSNEDMTLTYVTDIEDTDQEDEITNALPFQTALPRNAFVAFTGLSINVLEGLSCFKLTTPAWLTNPIGANIRVTVIIKPT